MSARYPQRDLTRLDALANWFMEHEDALTIACPRCEAPTGQPCRNPLTGKPIRAPAHWQRIHDADPTTRR